ncbi:CRAL-TRIO domain containing protein [Oryctes borbonicus]|uniref:CRAL-TRIO domain containing protein n=1 Tax=Oryctes borbonicus TaxID=1629725 RepID=A0A0T6AZK2_9SCAR|nr:CRAL-TRIO domain containing protein [Oryctes borbonicus]
MPGFENPLVIFFEEKFSRKAIKKKRFITCVVRRLPYFCVVYHTTPQSLASLFCCNIQHIFREYIAFPTKTEDGCIIVHHRLHDFTYWKYNMCDSMKLLCMTLDAALFEYPPTGLIVLFDMKGVSLMHLTRVKLGYVKIFFDYYQEALPVKLKAIHVLNSVYFLDKVMTIIKPFMKKQIYDLVRLLIDKYQ